MCDTSDIVDSVKYTGEIFRTIFYCFLICKVLVCWSSLNSKRVLMLVLVGNVLYSRTRTREQCTRTRN